MGRSWRAEFRANHRDLIAQLGADLRRVQLWENGDAARLGSADEILTRLSSHIHELPPDVWIDDPGKSHSRDGTGRFARRRASARRNRKVAA